jgi:hypothetical protein
MARTCSRRAEGEVRERMSISCTATSHIPVVGEIRCLLVSPHYPHRHYSALVTDPDVFWTWGNKDEEQ